ncbi:MAG: MlaD family protein, partial [Armatimonadota bacterium]|nr:MlaD family protein [Armatimonadota bacterium]
MSYAARVGAILLVGLLLLGGVFFYLSDRFWRARSYTVTVIFDNALGLSKGAKVRMAGVDVGVVGDITLTPDNRARVPLLIEKGRQIPEGSVFTIASGALIGEKYVDIAPGASGTALKPDTVVEGPQVKKPFQIEEVGGEVSKLIADFQGIAKNLNVVLGNPRLQRDLVQAIAHLAAATARAQEMLAGANAVVARNQSQVDRAMRNLVEASAELRTA